MKLPPLLIAALAGKAAAVVCWAFAVSPGIGAVFFFGLDPFVLYALFAPSGQGLCRVFTHFVTDRNEVWLTIDDGPDPDDTPKILDLLDRHQARATFFLIGERARRHPELVTEIIRRGHEVAHHTHTHPAATFWCALPARLHNELDDATSALRAAGAEPRRFRAPAGIKHLLLGGALQTRRMDYIGWNIRSGDCRARSTDAVTTSVMRRVKPGSVVLVHEGPSVPTALRVTTIAGLLAAFSAKNISCIIPDRAQLR